MRELNPHRRPIATKQPTHYPTELPVPSVTAADLTFNKQSPPSWRHNDIRAVTARSGSPRLQSRLPGRDTLPLKNQFVEIEI